MFGIDHASRCSKSKRTKYPKLHIVTLYWNLRSSFFRSDAWRPENDALSLLHPKELGLRVERKNGLVNAKSNMAEEESFEVRKQLLLTSYFEISPMKELKNCPAN